MQPMYLPNLATYSDLTLMHCGIRYEVHRYVLCRHSPVIDAACNGAFSEAASRIIEVRETVREVLLCMLNYVYHGTYEIEFGTAFKDWRCDIEEEPFPISCDGRTLEQIYASSFHVCMFHLADYYQISALKSLAADKFKAAMLGVELTSPAALLSILTQVYAKGPGLAIPFEALVAKKMLQYRNFVIPAIGRITENENFQPIVVIFLTDLNQSLQVNVEKTTTLPTRNALLEEQKETLEDAEHEWECDRRWLEAEKKARKTEKKKWETEKKKWETEKRKWEAEKGSLIALVHKRRTTGHDARQ